MALNQPWTRYTSSDGWDPNYALDGIADINFHTGCFHANGNGYEWMAVNLEQDIDVCGVKLLNRDSAGKFN